MSSAKKLEMKTSSSARDFEVEVPTPEERLNILSQKIRDSSDKASSSSMKNDSKSVGSIGSCMQMFIANILGLCDGAESSENSLSPAKPA